MNFQPAIRKVQMPDQVPLTKLQAQRLSNLAGIDAADLAGRSLSQIGSKYRQVSRELLSSRRISGTVSKRDPATGVEYPVPCATVYAEETTCSLLGLFPAKVPWAWLFPFQCETEVVAETVTDARGNFSVLVPRFEIEWILRLQMERLGHLEFFTEPTAGCVQYMQGDSSGPDEAREASDRCASLLLKPGTALHQKAEQALGRELIRLLFTEGRVDALRLSASARRAGSARETQADDLGLDATALQGLDLARYYGPFLRGYDVVVPEWMPIFDLPDVCFRVTQDVDGSGVQQAIHSGRLFEVPLRAGDISHLTLAASARASSTNLRDRLRWLAPNPTSNNSCERV